ncbi:MAG: CPBP family intramembrane glutamic endopeptidase [Flavobacteriaceae bacterium]
MFIEEGFKGLHDWGRYFLGTIIIFFAWQFVGAVPLMGALVYKMIDTGDFPSDITAMAEMLGSNLFLLLMLFSFAVGLLAVALTAKMLHRQSMTSLTTIRSRIDWKRIGFAFVLWAIVSTLFILLDIYLSPDDYEFNFNAIPFLILLVIAVLFIPLQTSFEEYYMRAYLMQGIGILSGKKWIPLLITSLIFGLLHIFNPEVDKLGYGIMVFYMGTGLFLGIMTLMDDGIELALGFHAANNLTAAILVTADWTAFQTNSLYRDVSEPGLGWDVFLPVLVIYPILLIIFAKRYGWNNWKERLLGDVKPLVKDDSFLEKETDDR